MQNGFTAPDGWMMDGQHYSILYDASKGYTGRLARELRRTDVVEDAFPRSYKDRFETNLQQMLYNLLRCVQGERLMEGTDENGTLLRVAVPLKQMFKRKSRYKEMHMSHRHVRRILDVMEAESWVQVQVGYPSFTVPGSGSGQVTRVWPIGDFKRTLAEHTKDIPGNVEFVLTTEVLELKQDGALVGYRDSDDTDLMRERLRAYNERVMDSDWSLRLPASALDLNPSLTGVSGLNSEATTRTHTTAPRPITGNSSDAVPRAAQDTLLGIAERTQGTGLSVLRPRIDGSRLVYDLPDYHMQHIRKFCRGRFDRGGRLYALYQNLPSSWRRHLYRDGERCVELDYGQLHAHMLYHKVGHELPDGDLYDLDLDVDRGVLKELWFVLINAENHQSMYAYVKANLDLGPHTAKEVVHAMKAKHQPIADFFHSDEGVMLQRMDSRLAMRVVERTGALTVHDSFIIEQSREEELKTAMRECYREMTGHDCPVEVA